MIKRITMKKGFVSWTMLVVIVLIALAVGIALLYAIWGGGEGAIDLLVQRLRGF